MGLDGIAVVSGTEAARAAKTGGQLTSAFSPVVGAHWPAVVLSAVECGRAAHRHRPVCGRHHARAVCGARAEYLYIGIDASPAQVDWNTKWAKDNLTPDERAYTPVYKCTDGGEMPRILREVCEAHGWPADTKADMMLTCPPYWVKEVYEG